MHNTKQKTRHKMGIGDLATELMHISGLVKEDKFDYIKSWDEWNYPFTILTLEIIRLKGGGAE